MSVPVSIEHAAGGGITSGDRVDVISVSDGLASYVVTNVEVIGTSDRQAGAFGVASDFFVVLAVDADQALEIAAALESTSIEIIKSTGALAIEENDAGS